MGALKILPLLILVSLMSFVVRIGDIVTEVRAPSQVLTASAIAADDSKKEEGAIPVNVPEGLSDDEPTPLPETDWADPTVVDMEFTETQSKVLMELKERRIELDDREARADQREALIKVTEKRIEEKISELDSLRLEIVELLGNQSEEEEARMQSLVKIYSGMKPKDASAIFNNLDMGILLQVVSRMSERKSAPIIASMDIQKAQELTTLLAEQRQLPFLPQ
jgi:flagellar motility protein MotE (MotC chaperone)